MEVNILAIGDIVTFGLDFLRKKLPALKGLFPLLNSLPLFI